MEKMEFNHGWSVYAVGEENHKEQITLPHDAMLKDPKNNASPGGVNTGWYEARDYVYEKEFRIEKKSEGEKLLLEFEGIYHKATVYFNHKKLVYHEYGYTGFYVDITEEVVYQGVNHIRIEVTNSDQPNSRWYSGSGLYRPVWLLRFPKKHILPDGIRVTTAAVSPAKLHVEVKATDTAPVRIEVLEASIRQDEAKGNVSAADPILDGSESQAQVVAAAEGAIKEGICKVILEVPEARLWTTRKPYLYTLRVIYGDKDPEIRTMAFGIRTVTCDADNGFCINGERVILRGACVHHDNGLLGACAYPFAEERKVKLLKQQGYNAIRSAHNPCSKAMLEACDRWGMLLMDEYVDVWYIHKTKYDYADRVEENYKEDWKAIIDKDYNHPCVVLYSTGNEVAESAQKRGIRLCGEMTDYIHSMDPGRPVTCGINIFFNFLSSMGFGVYSDKKADAALKDAGKKKAVGSEFFNNMAGMFGSGFMKWGATLYPCDLKTRDAFANMDVAGYNYGIDCYEKDLKKYPSRLILGTETFCSDAGRFMDLAKREKRIIGDFVWAGMDYLGEVGIGSWEYKDYAPDFSHGTGWVSAGSGRIDLTGKPLGEMRYTRVAFGLETLGLAVRPVHFSGQKHSPSAWKMSDALESWSFEGCEGTMAEVEVYSRAARVSVYLNGKCKGSKKPDRDYRCTFRIPYEAGELKAAAYDPSGKMIAARTLKTAGKETKLSLFPEQGSISLKEGLCYVRMCYTDDNGIIKPTLRGNIQVQAEGGRILGIGSACPYYPLGYQGDTADTYYGEALVIIRPESAGQIRIHAESPYGSADTQVEVTSNGD